MCTFSYFQLSIPHLFSRICSEITDHFPTSLASPYKPLVLKELIDRLAITVTPPYLELHSLFNAILSSGFEDHYQFVLLAFSPSVCHFPQAIYPDCICSFLHIKYEFKIFCLYFAKKMSNSSVFAL